MVDFRGRTNFSFGFAANAERSFFEEPRPRFCPLVVVEFLEVLLSAIVVSFPWLNDLSARKNGQIALKYRQSHLGS